MGPRSFITNLKDGATIRSGEPTLLRGIAFGGDCGVAQVDVSVDGGKSWQTAALGRDEGKYGFRQWQSRVTLENPGAGSLMVRCTNTNHEAQPEAANWNPGGFMRNLIETTTVKIA